MEAHKIYYDLDDTKGKEIETYHLELISEDIDDFPLEILQMYNLRVLKIHKCGLRYIPKELKSISKLVRLELDYNEFRYFYPHIFEITDLEFVSLGGNKITNTSNDKIEIRHKNIKELYLDDNQISMIGLCEIPTLQNLSLERNLISDISTILNFKNLRWLNLNENNISVIPEKISQNKHLKTLFLRKNRLEKIPTGLFDLKDLELLNLSQNPIEYFPDLNYRSKNLRYLNLSSTNIKELPSSISGITKLEELILTKSSIQKLPENINELSNLRELSIALTPIEYLPESVLDLRQLEKLYIQKTNIKNLDRLLKIDPSFEGKLQR